MNLRNRVASLEARRNSRLPRPAENVLALAAEHPGQIPESVVAAARDAIAAPPRDRATADRRLLDEGIRHYEAFAALTWDENGHTRTP